MDNDLITSRKKAGSGVAHHPRRGNAAPAMPMQPLGTGRSACACGGSCPRCRAGATAQAAKAASGQADLRISGEITAPSSSGQNESLEAEDTGPAVIDGDPQEGAEPLGGNSSCPVNAVFLSNVAGAGKAGCQVPDGHSGASRLSQYMVRGVSPIPSGGLSIGEQFQAIDDPYGAFGLLKPVTATTDTNGKFDDCYILASKSALPPDFVLKVDQNHLYNGQAISRNVITYTPGNVGVRHCKRKPDSCEFNDVCRLA